MMDLYRTQSNTKAVRTHKRRDFTLINDRRTFGGECARLSARDSRCRPYEILCTLLVEEQTGLIHVIIHSHLVEKVKGSNASVWSGPDAAANDWRVADQKVPRTIDITRRRVVYRIQSTRPGVPPWRRPCARLPASSAP